MWLLLKRPLDNTKASIGNPCVDAFFLPATKCALFLTPHPKQMRSFGSGTPPTPGRFQINFLSIMRRKFGGKKEKDLKAKTA